MDGCQIYGPFWISIIIRQLIFRVPKRGTIIFASTYVYVQALGEQDDGDDCG